ncbi:hypothetical protein D1007_23569 [Hordeum vulgare]|nr:hypothetical protein D1007_23569 [Hordeum vulgare]
MLREEHAVPTRRSFLNTSTGECVQVKIPQLLDHHALALTPEGLLLLLDKPQRTAVRLLNPFTGQLTELPPFNTLLPHIAHYQQRDDDDFARIMTAWGSGLADDGSTVVLYLRNHHLIGIAKPGDDRWSLLRLRDNMLGKANIMFAGRFYCVTQDGVMVLQIDEGHPPRLEVAANLNMDVLLSVDYMHFVDNCGELMLVHRQRRDKHSNPTNKFNMWRRRYDTYRVDLDSRTLIPVKSFGGKGRAVFMGMYCSFSVSIESFPAGSVSADTIYLSFDFGETETSAHSQPCPVSSRRFPAGLRAANLVECKLVLVGDVGEDTTGQGWLPRENDLSQHKLITGELARVDSIVAAPVKRLTINSDEATQPPS